MACVGSTGVSYGCSIKECFRGCNNQGSKQSHARNSSCALTDASQIHSVPKTSCGSNSFARSWNSITSHAPFFDHGLHEWFFMCAFGDDLLECVNHGTKLSWRQSILCKELLLWLNNRSYGNICSKRGLSYGDVTLHSSLSQATDYSQKTGNCKIAV